MAGMALTLKPRLHRTSGRPAADALAPNRMAGSADVVPMPEPRLHRTSGRPTADAPAQGRMAGLGPRGADALAAAARQVGLAHR